jgi:hypothetical protein
LIASKGDAGHPQAIDKTSMGFFIQSEELFRSGVSMNPKPIIEGLKKVPWDNVLKSVKDIAKTAGAVGTAIVVWQKIVRKQK